MVESTYEYRQKIESDTKYILADKIMQTAALPHAHSYIMKFIILAPIELSLSRKFQETEDRHLAVARLQ
jgi:hypothetical protein